MQCSTLFLIWLTVQTLQVPRIQNKWHCELKSWSHLEPWYSSYTLHLPIQMYFLPDLEFSNLKVIDHRYISTFLTQACSSMLQLLTHVYLMFAEQVGVKLQLSPWFIFWKRKICSGQQILRRWVWNANVKFMQQLYTSEWSKFMRATQQ